MTYYEPPESFFHRTEASCAIYKRLQDPTEPHHRLGRLNVERVWERCWRFVDKGVPQKASRDLLPFWWELYLADSLLRCNKKLIPRAQREFGEKGPDLVVTSPKVWIEATMPEATAELSEPPFGQAYDIPDDAFILRLTSAFKTKSKKMLDYRGHNVIGDQDATIIAISAAKLNFRFQDLPTPRIVSALLAAGHLTLGIDRQSRMVKEHYLEYRKNVKKSNGVDVETDWFLNQDYAHVSAVLYNFCDCINPTDSGFILVHNPLAQNPLEHGWIRMGREFWLEDTKLRVIDHSGVWF